MWCVIASSSGVVAEHKIRVVCGCQGPQGCSRAGGRGADSAFDHSLLVRFAVGTTRVQLWVPDPHPCRKFPLLSLPPFIFVTVQAAPETWGLWSLSFPDTPSPFPLALGMPAPTSPPSNSGGRQDTGRSQGACLWGVTPGTMVEHSIWGHTQWCVLGPVVVSEYTWPRCDCGRKSH